MSILNWAERDESFEDYKRALWQAAMAKQDPRDRAILLAELERLNIEGREGLKHSLTAPTDVPPLVPPFEI